jgi:hypothetical protein
MGVALAMRGIVFAIAIDVSLQWENSVLAVRFASIRSDFRGSESMTDDAIEIFPIRTLRRVVPIARTHVHGGIAVTLFALEDYADGFDLKYRLLPQKGHPIRELSAKHLREGHARMQAILEERRSGSTRNIAPTTLSFDPLEMEQHRALWPKPLWEVRDDRGNSYHSTDRQGGGESASGEFHMEVLFAPALDLGAHELQIQVAVIAWATLPPMKDERPPVRVDPGPWIFPVNLAAGLHVVQTGESE